MPCEDFKVVFILDDRQKGFPKNILYKTLADVKKMNQYHRKVHNTWFFTYCTSILLKILDSRSEKPVGRFHGNIKYIEKRYYGQ